MYYYKEVDYDHRIRLTVKHPYNHLNRLCQVLAMCYDFDKTLTPDDMQAQGFIQSVGYNERAN